MQAENGSSSDLRYDLRIVANWVPHGASVLGLGCGDGELLYYLEHRKQAVCTGIEKDEEKVARCIEKGLNVLHGDINREVDDYPDEAFDLVVLAQTLQQIYAPDRLIRAMLRIGKRSVVSFPNFSHWQVRLQLLSHGIAPITAQLPYTWYNTPNIRVVTLKDFRAFSREVGFRIYEEVAVAMSHRNTGGQVVRFLPNLRATYGIFLIGKAF